MIKPYSPPPRRPAADPRYGVMQYPHHMSWRRRQWVLRRGQALVERTPKGDIEPEVFVVDHITRSPIQGEPPRIVLERQPPEPF